MGIATGAMLLDSYRARSGRTRFRVSSRLGDRSEILGLESDLDWASGWKMT